MTAAQMICHRADSFRVVMGEKAWKTERVSVPWIPLAVWFLKWAAFGVPLRWPRGLETRPEVDRERGGTSPKDSKRMATNDGACWTAAPASPEILSGNPTPGSA
jgi:hypothetical protein